MSFDQNLGLFHKLLSSTYSEAMMVRLGCRISIPSTLTEMLKEEEAEEMRGQRRSRGKV